MLMAVHSSSQILLLDEHTSALDPKMQHILMDYTVKQVGRYGLTTMITHKMDDAVQYGNRLIMLHKGKIVADIKEHEKKALKTQDLLALFHAYENQIFVSHPQDSHKDPERGKTMHKHSVGPHDN